MPKEQINRDVTSRELIAVIADKAALETDELCELLGCKDARSFYNKKAADSFTLGDLAIVLKRCGYTLCASPLSSNRPEDCSAVPAGEPCVSSVPLANFMKIVQVFGVRLALFDPTYGVYSTLDEAVKPVYARKLYNNTFLTTTGGVLIYTKQLPNGFEQLYKQHDRFFLLSVGRTSDTEGGARITLLSDEEANDLVAQYNQNRRF